MCNKYAKYSKVSEYEKYDEVQRLQMISEQKVVNMQCLSCCNSCNNFLNNDGKCEHYKQRMSLEVLNDEIKIQNINLKKLCKNNSLDYSFLIKGLKGKKQLPFRYYKILENRITEIPEYIPYLEDM